MSAKRNAALPSYIREWRKVRNLSQAELAALSGTSDSHISRIETGATKRPTERMMRALAEAMKLSVYDLFRNPMKPPQW